MKRTRRRSPSQRNENATNEEDELEDREGNLTPSKIKSEEPPEDTQQSPQTPKSDFANFAESILSPNALDTPIVSFADVLTPREWSPFGLDMLSTTKSKSLSFGGMDLFDSSLNENSSNHSKKFFKEARSLASLSSPASADIIHVKEPASVHTHRSATKYRDLFNSSNEHLDSRHLPFLDEGEERLASTGSQPSHQEDASEENVVEKAAAGILEMKSGRGKKRTRSPNCVEETKETNIPYPQSQLQTTKAPYSDITRPSTHMSASNVKISTHPSPNSFPSMLPLTRPSNVLAPHDAHRITTPHAQAIQGTSTSNSPELHASSNITCNCKKSRCLKLYCDCFRLQKYCLGCNCKDCANLKSFEKERISARIAITDRNPEAFKPRIAIFDNKKSHETFSPRSSSGASSVIGLHQSGCHCKKSACLKKYCECFQAGVPCHDRCRCQDCQNTPELHHGNNTTNKADDNSGLFATPKAPLAASASARLPTQIQELPQLFTSSDVSDDKPMYNKAQAEQAAVDIVCAFLRGQIVVPGLSPSTFVPNPSLSEDLPEILKQLAPGCFTPHSSENYQPTTPSHPTPGSSSRSISVTPSLSTFPPSLLKTEKEHH